MENKIKLWFINDRGYSFNADDYMKIRRDFRIVGTLIGSWNRKGHSNDKGLPAIYTKNELQLLYEIEAIELVAMKTDVQHPDWYQTFIDQNTREQNDSGIVISDPDHTLIEIPIEVPYLSDADTVSVQFQIENNIKYRVFKDLWKRDKVITTGDSFGGDFLIYPGDPLRYHASHIVIVRDRLTDNEIPCTEFIAYARLSVIVNKLCVLAYEGAPNGEIHYQTVQWEGSDKINKVF